MTTYTHGGDLFAATAQYGDEVLDFSANLSPLGMPEEVRRAAAEAITGAIHYPDALCRQLREALATRDGVRPEQILCGNGAADLIFRLCYTLHPRRALITAPTFSEYEQALHAADCRVFYHRLSPGSGFLLGDSILDAITSGLDIIFLCNPNNPTGREIPPRLMQHILMRCAGMRIRLVVDECFLDLADGAEEGGLSAFLDSNPNLILLRAFTKSYAMPGLRLGYCLSADAALLERLETHAQPWSVSGPAQAAGMAAAKLPDFPVQARGLITEERAWLTARMEELGLMVFPSAANYLLFQAKGMADLKERMLCRGILIRSCANYVGLGQDYYRIAVRPHGENERLIKALGEILA